MKRELFTALVALFITSSSLPLLAMQGGASIRTSQNSQEQEKVNELVNQYMEIRSVDSETFKDWADGVYNEYGPRIFKALADKVGRMTTIHSPHSNEAYLFFKGQALPQVSQSRNQLQQNSGVDLPDPRLQRKPSGLRSSQEQENVVIDLPDPRLQRKVPDLRRNQEQENVVVDLPDPRLQRKVPGLRRNQEQANDAANLPKPRLQPKPPGLRRNQGSLTPQVTSAILPKAESQSCQFTDRPGTKVFGTLVVEREQSNRGPMKTYWVKSAGGTYKDSGENYPINRQIPGVFIRTASGCLYPLFNLASEDTRKTRLEIMKIAGKNFLEEVHGTKATAILSTDTVNISGKNVPAYAKIQK